MSSTSSVCVYVKVRIYLPEWSLRAAGVMSQANICARVHTAILHFLQNKNPFTGLCNIVDVEQRNNIKFVWRFVKVHNIT